VQDLLGVRQFDAREKLAAIEREVKMRQRVYPRWVATGKMKKDAAEREIAVFEAIAADYRK